MTIFVDPKPVKLFLANPNLISDIKVKKSVQDIEKAMENCANLREWVETNNKKREEIKVEDQMGQKEEEPGSQ